ncbi:hypothetical protein K7640_10335 [Micromonospora sp. PLK6-60]|uniref:hypothetical protein n=1 Tax=Micromonospora sp. PLK6-60 TaxID=2873383 RepID=UPI001CA76996|nr:hypothetical protein [Micromonospora sp. PLK6-60]MBY8872237.1 hypothetical protein [Micromonospora sp. PLK6-60]
MRRVIALLGLPLLVVAAGCAPVGSVAADPMDHEWEAFHQRAADIADAWRADPGRAAGFVPLQGPTVLTGDPKFDPDTEAAFQAGWYRDQIELPAAVPAPGTVRFPDGPTTVPLISAAEAYRQLDQGDPPPCDGRPMNPPGRPAATGPATEPGPDTPVHTEAPTACVPLTVTGARLGTVPLRTTRGTAEVPAWLFTVAELAVPVARVAVAPAAVTEPSDAARPDRPAPENVVGAQGLERVDGTRLRYTVGVGSCDTGITPLVTEWDDLVVVGAGVVRSTGVCDMMLKLEPVEVDLRAPLGDRPVLDAVTATPLRLDEAARWR